MCSRRDDDDASTEGRHDDASTGTAAHSDAARARAHGLCVLSGTLHSVLALCVLSGTLHSVLALCVLSGTLHSVLALAVMQLSSSHVTVSLQTQSPQSTLPHKAAASAS